MTVARRFGPLDATLVRPSEAPETGGLICVILHGFGAPGTDLVPLGRELRGPPGTTFVFPAAPLDLGPAFAGGRAWWEIDMVALQVAMATGRHRELAGSVPDGLASAREKLGRAVDAVVETFAPAKLVLGGFSQGAMLATDYALRTDRALAGLLLFSGTVIAEAEWRPLMSRRAGLEVAQSHGRQDPVLPFAGAERLRELLAGGGAEVRFTPFDGGHEIPRPALAEASALLRRVA